MPTAATAATTSVAKHDFKMPQTPPPHIVTHFAPAVTTLLVVRATTTAATLASVTT
jgi:hypothetical protein